MNQMLQMLIQQSMAGKFQNSPQMMMYKQMMEGKSSNQQIQTLINLAKSRGLDVNQKVFSEEDLKLLQLK